MADAVTIGGRELRPAPLTLRGIHALMRAGHVSKLPRYAELPDHEQLTLMVGFVAAALGIEEPWLWDNVGVADFDALRRLFEAVLEASRLVGEKPEPGEAVSR
ncbi:hypothetical protein [Anaeromyxobacter sp. PSR-1]|uniref:hypothetical protein n=1 Tax=Anaeromyxobacter sp. PSR-1 TaxID=1300915 RepID=UPI0005DA80FA|nr:hypothetical protein [Anaeromyxobacter sp. PSR-1]GAO01962.1 hypothetical protein PSR1_00827 [Anaeromyxobacter sp. PSR-1]